MESLAPGQLLGYTLQFPRALYHLLKSDVGDSVSVEVLGDVATAKSDDSVILEEDKSSTVGNPVTDKSTDLWKTFSNWIKAINDGLIDVKKTRFILYTTQKGRHSIVNKFSEAQTKDVAEKVIATAKETLKDIEDGHEIWQYFDFVMNKNELVLLEIIQRFELEIGSGTGLLEVKHELKRIHVPDTLIELVCNSLSGWLQNLIMEKIASRQLSIVKWEEYNHQFLVLFDRARRYELLDFTLENPLATSTIEQQIKTRPMYLMQLEIIKAGDDEIFEAVTDFMKAKVNRDKWIENEIIDETIAEDFETKLCKYWDNQMKRIELTQRTLNEFERAQLLLLDCKLRQEKISDMSPPSSTIPGTFHALANEPVLGWHFEWKTHFNIQKV